MTKIHLKDTAYCHCEALFAEAIFTMHQGWFQIASLRPFGAALAMTQMGL
jgi:hypothetical protein